MKLLSKERVKRYALMLTMMMMTICAGAVPAKPGITRTLKLSDGTTITARLVGDENGHFWIGQDGKTYTINDDDVAKVVDSGTIKANAKVRRQQSNVRRCRRMAPRKVGEVGSITGEKKGIIILVNFSDESFKSSNNNALYNRISNEKNFTYDNFKGSMYDYFYAQSEGTFQLTFDVVGPVTVSQKRSYYGSNDSDGNDKHPAEMIIEALELVDNQVNFKDYDWDGDGEVDQVYVVYAGKGEADGGASSTIWPHEWTLTEAVEYEDGTGAQWLDGVKIDTYACGGELNGETGTIAGIGTMCHEFSHCLGYPDFYDIDYSGGQGMFEWDLMDSGSYNGDGYLPAGFTSYERWVAGWKIPTELTSTRQISNMKSLQDGGDSYIIYNKGNRNEYFLLENRQQTKWDAGIPGEGLLILHVDYDSGVWAKNQPNDVPSHQRMTWVAADNKYQYTMYQGTKYYTSVGAKNDPFPYGSVNAFSATTTPAAKFYNMNSDGTYYMDSSIESITQNSDGTVSFKFTSKEDPVTPPEPTVEDGNFEFVTDASTLVDGDSIVLYALNGKENVVMSTTQNDNNRNGTNDLTMNSDGSITPGSSVQIVTLEKSGDKFLFNVGDGYLYAASSSKNYMRTKTTADDNAKATISISQDGLATIIFQGKNTHNQLLFNPNTNNGSPLFSCYEKKSNNTSLPKIYRQRKTTLLVDGDVNGDGKLDDSDVILLINIMLGKADENSAADVNNDGVIGIGDVTALVNMILNF